MGQVRKSQMKTTTEMKVNKKSANAILVQVQVDGSLTTCCNRLDRMCASYRRLETRFGFSLYYVLRSRLLYLRSRAVANGRAGCAVASKCR